MFLRKGYGKKAKKTSGDPDEKDVIAGIIRVDQAGEYGARRIYKGQLAVLPDNEEIMEMYEQEKEHLDFFNEYMKKNKIRPTAFSIAMAFLRLCSWLCHCKTR